MSRYSGKYGDRPIRHRREDSDDVDSFKAGDRVTIVNTDKYSGHGTVLKQLPKNVDVQLDAGRRVRFSPYFLQAYDGGAPATGTTYADAIAKLGPPIVLGSTVQFKDPSSARRFPGVHVVLAFSGDKVRVAKLGGDGNRYVRAIPSHLELVTLDAPAYV